jgi:hypothetical protein
MPLTGNDWWRRRTSKRLSMCYNEKSPWISESFIITSIWGISIYLSACLSVCLSRAYSPRGRWSLFQFLNPYTVGRPPWTGDQPVSRPLPTHRTTQTENKRTQTSMTRVGFEPTIPVFQRAKTVHALDRAATAIKAAVYRSSINRITSCNAISGH